jgi:putative cell wall-binding protein
MTAAFGAPEQSAGEAEAQGGGVAPLAAFEDLEGTGSEEDPYLITDADDLMHFAYDAAADSSSTTGSYYRITADIDLSVALATADWPLIQNFAGHLDGGYHTVSGFSLTSNSTSPKGFLSSGGGAGSLKNLIVQGRLDASGAGAAGGIVGTANNTFTLSNIGSEIDIYSSSDYTGGIVGSTGYSTTGSISIRGSYYNGTLSGSQSDYYHLGGIIGFSYSTQIEDCMNLGTIVYQGTKLASDSWYCIGGVIGYLSPGQQVVGSLTNCVNIGEIVTPQVTATNRSIGALIGFGGTPYQGATGVHYQDTYYGEDSYATAIGSAEGPIAEPAAIRKLSEEEIQSYAFAAGGEYFETPFLSYVENSWPALPYALTMRGAPAITSTSTDAGYVLDTATEEVDPLKVSAAPLVDHVFSGTGGLSYQWYNSSLRSQSTAYGVATLIDGAESETYTPPVDDSTGTGYTYYFCKVTNTWTEGEEQKTASAYSAPVLISVYEGGTTAGTVSIKTEPKDSTTEFLRETELSVEATVAGMEEELSYQWYKNDTNIAEDASAEDIKRDAIPIFRARQSSYRVPTLEPGEHYYFCEITNTVAQVLTDTMDTRLVKVTVAPSYSIGTAEELMHLADDVAVYAGYFAGITAYLTDDINLSEHCGPDLGVGGAPLSFNSVMTNFLGSFDGGYHTIRNYYVERPAEDQSAGSGLFHSVTGGGTFENVFIEGSIDVNSAYVGALIDDTSASSPVTVRNVGADVRIINANIFSFYTGGIVGRLGGSSTVTNCYNHGNVTSTSNGYVGGIVGNLNGIGSISGCYNSGDITGGTSVSSVYVGGIVGNGGGNQVSNSYNSGTVSKTASGIDNLGPIVGSVSSQLAAGTECYYLDTTATGSAAQPNVKAVTAAELKGAAFPARLGPAFRYQEDGFPQLFFEQGAGWPTIITQPLSARYAKDDPAEPLIVAAALPIRYHVGWQGEPSYQWYQNTVRSTVGAVPVGTQDDSFTPGTTVAGTRYYYCAVTNTYDEGKIETVFSNIATVAVLDGAPTPPGIIDEPQDISMSESGALVEPFSVAATLAVADEAQGASLSYQWYYNTTGLSPTETGIPTDKDTELSGATGSSYAPLPQGRVGEQPYYYYCIVTTSFGDLATEAVSVSRAARVTLTPARIIYTPADLLDFAQEVNGVKVVEGQTLPANTFTGKTVELAADLDLSTYPATAGNWTPIAWTNSLSFDGIFNGNGHTIENLTYRADSITSPVLYTGLFGRIRSATIKDLRLKGDVTYTNLTNGGWPIGLLAATDSGTSASPSTISNVEVDGTITIIRDSSAASWTTLNTGIALGLASRNASTRLTNVVTKGRIDITGNYQINGSGVAGVASGQAPTTFTDCGNEADITIDSTYTQPISFVSGVGSYASSFTRCYNKGDITVKSPATSYSYIGGICAGSTTGTTTFSQCYNTGNITGTYYVSGIAYGTATTTITGCYNTGTLTTTSAGTNVAAINNAAVSASSTNNFYLAGSVVGTQPAAAIGEPRDADALKGSGILAALNTTAAGYVPVTDGYPEFVWELGSGAPVITGEYSDPEPARVKASETATLSVTAVFPTDERATGTGGTSSYQWYKGTNALNNYGVKIAGEDGESYVWTPSSSDTPGWHYFYCVVTNKWGAGTDESKSAVSNIFKVSLVTTDDVWKPVFTTEPQDTWYIQSDEDSASPVLSVDATPPNDTNGAAVGEEISYQWYSNTTASTEGATKLWGETGTSYTPPITELGTTWYFCRASNSYQESNIVSTDSAVVKAVVWDDAEAAPVISVRPEPARYVRYATDAVALSVTADKPEVPDTGSDGILSYQWYYNTDDAKPNPSNDTAVTGVLSSPTLIPDTTLTLDTYYYYCVVTNTFDIPNPSYTGYTTETISDTAQIAIVSETPAAKPVVDSTALADVSYIQKEAPASLSITADFGSATEGFDPPELSLSYQWYSNTTGIAPSGDALTGDRPSPGDVEIPNENTASYTPPATSVTGTTYYYCLVTNTFEKVKLNSTASALVAVTIDPLLRISTAGEFKAFADAVKANEANYYDGYTVVLEADIDLADGTASTNPWAPIGGTSERSFTGTFDGQGHTISGLLGTSPRTGGIFGYVKGATIENFVVQGFLTSSAPSISGVVANVVTNGATAPTIIRNVGSEVDIHSTATTGTLSVGGIIASAAGDSRENGLYIEGCYYKGDKGDSSRNYDIFTELVSTGSTSSVGGIIGNAGRYVFIRNCYNAGDIYSCSAFGGIAGTVYYSYSGTDTLVQNSYNSGTVDYAAGVEDVYKRIGAIVGHSENPNAVQQFSTLYYLSTSCQKSCYYDYEASMYQESFAEVLRSVPATELSAAAQVASLNGTQSPAPWKEGSLYPALFWEPVTYGTPVITKQPVAFSYAEQYKAPTALSVEVKGPATEKDAKDGTLGFQWYSTTAPGTKDGSPILDATESEFTPPTADLGQIWYYCVITNTWAGTDPGSASVTSTPSHFGVVTPATAAKPEIIDEPLKSQTVAQFEAVQPLTVVSTVEGREGAGELSWQWYRSDSESFDDTAAELIPGAEAATYTPSSSIVGTNYYFCVVTNTLEIFKTGTVVTHAAKVQVAGIPISTPADLLAVAKAVNSGTDFYSGVTLELTNDIDLGNNTATASWTPIGTSTTNNFRGSFYGNGHTISGLSIEASSATVPYLGLFGVIQGATLKDFVVKGSLSVESPAAMYVGGVVAYVYSPQRPTTAVQSAILNVGSEVRINADLGTASYVGGVAGYTLGYTEVYHTISSCYYKGTLTDTGYSAGGIAGYAAYTDFNGCYNTGAISIVLNPDTVELTVGGIVAYRLSGGTMDACYNAGTITVAGTEGSTATQNTGAIVASNSIQGITRTFYLDNSLTNDGIAGTEARTSAVLQSDSFLAEIDGAGGYYKKGATYPLLKWEPDAIVDLGDGFAIEGINPQGYTYTGSPVIPQGITVVKGETTLDPATDYSLSYTNNTNAGKATITATGQGNYQGQVQAHFTINPADCTALNGAISAAQQARAAVTQAADGSQLAPSVFWAPPAAFTALDTAIATAQGVAQAASPTQQQVDNARDALETATATFNAARKPGTKQGRTQLEEKEWPRLDGGKPDGGRYDTMQAIVNEGWDSSEYVIVASGMNFPDALAASSLAGIYGAPVVLTESGNLTAQSAETIRGLGATKAYIIGGEAAVSPQTMQTLEGIVGGGRVARISGDNRIATALDIYEKGKTPEAGQVSWGDTAIIANGFSFADALSVSPFAHITRSPIFLSTPEVGLDEATANAINTGGFKKVIVVGGTAAVPESIRDQLASSGAAVERWSGANRYETSADIVEKSLLNSNGALSLNNLVCATGDNYPDALAGGAFAGHTGTVLLLVHGTQTGGLSGLDLISEHKDEIGKGYVLGGAAAVPENLLALLQGSSRN